MSQTAPAEIGGSILRIAALLRAGGACYTGRAREEEEERR
jgi:hypothetical protein